MGQWVRQAGVTVATLFGLSSAAWLLSAFNGDVVGIFTSRDRRFVLLLVTCAATLSAMSSKVIGFGVGFLALTIAVSQSYPGQEVDIAALRVASLLLLLFELGLGLLIWFDRKLY